MNAWTELREHPWRTALLALLGTGVSVAATVGVTSGLAVALLGAGATIGGFGLLGAVRQWRAISRARTTEGTVIRSEPVELELMSRTWRSDFEPGVEYRYRVDGQGYVGDTVWPGPIQPQGGTGPRPTVKRFLEDYPEGETVPVYYDPATPSRSFLEPHRGTGGYIVVGAFALGFLLAGSLLGLRAGLLPP